MITHVFNSQFFGMSQPGGRHFRHVAQIGHPEKTSHATGRVEEEKE